MKFQRYFSTTALAFLKKNDLSCLGNLTFEILAFFCLHLKVMTLAMHHLYTFEFVKIAGV